MGTLLTGKKILIVEDDPMMLQVLLEIIRKDGATARGAENGQQALDILASFPVDLVISDVQMPLMDGVELLKRIRSLDARFPLVLLATGQAMVDEAMALRLGASGLMQKPFVYKEFRQKIHALLNLAILAA